MKKPDPSLLNDLVSPKVIEAMKAASNALTKAAVRHVVAGGLAVSANGYPRTTKDVDFLVGNETFEHHEGGLVTLRAGIPFQVNGVAIDFLSPDPDEDFLEEALAAPAGSFLEAPALVYLKLKASRLRDQVDVIELIKSGIDVDACRAYLKRHRPEFAEKLDGLTARAEEE